MQFSKGEEPNQDESKAYLKKKITSSPEQVYLLVPSVIPASVYSVEPKIQPSEGWVRHRMAVRFV